VVHFIEDHVKCFSENVEVKVVSSNNPGFDNHYPAILYNDGSYKEFR
jgi:hypothetical protein